MNLIAELVLVQDSLAHAGAHRLAFGELQHLIWQAQTFGFHLAELEVRQHSGVHARALEELARRRRRVRDDRRGARDDSRGRRGCRTNTASTRAAATSSASPHRRPTSRRSSSSRRSRRAAKPPVLDVVPLFETQDDLQRCVAVLEEALQLPPCRRGSLPTAGASR